MDGTTGWTLPLLLEVVVEVVIEVVVEWVLKAVVVPFLATIRLTCMVTST
jgi:hypothetical protein